MIIYKIENKINGKIYIGQTIKDLNGRITSHLKSKLLVGNALRKYGLQYFDISIIDSADDRDTLCDKEMEYINFYDSRHPNGYNLTNGGDGWSGGHHTKETRKKISIKTKKAMANLSPEKREKLKTREGLSSPMKDKHHTKEAKAKLRAHNLGKRQSIETIEKRKISSVGRKYPLRPDVRGDNNPAKRPEVREKLRNNNAMKRPEVVQKMVDAKRGKHYPKISQSKIGKKRPDVAERNRLNRNKKEGALCM